MLTLLYSILKPVLPKHAAISNSFYFLRRLVITTHLPPSLRNGIQLRDDCPTIHLLIVPVHSPTANDIVTVLQPHIDCDHLPVIRITHVPSDPPKTAEQAAQWSEKYWPCTFNPASQTIQRVPLLRTLREAQAELDNSVHLDSYFSLADYAAGGCVDGGFGREVAAVIVDPVQDEVIAVAGDARWFGQVRDGVTDNNHRNKLHNGKPENHALMRAIAMVAKKEGRRRSGNESPSSIATESYGADPGQNPITTVELLYTATNAKNLAFHEHLPGMPLGQSTIKPDAYLCNGLDVYLTHEPCVACSMAMIHSRFRACVFIRRLPATGGLCAERDDGGLGYGLFWREELNWRVLTFQYVPRDGEFLEGSKKEGNGDEEHVEAIFHA